MTDDPANQYDAVAMIDMHEGKLPHYYASSEEDFATPRAAPWST